MEYLRIIGNILETIQNQGGLLLGGFLALFYISRVDRTSRDRDHNHELYYHHTDLKQKKENP